MNYNGPERFTVKQLAKQLYLSLTGAYELMRVLLGAGMAEYMPDPSDRRNVWYKFTPQKGKRKRMDD